MANIRYSQKVKDRAFALYCEGKSTREIARAVKVKEHHTVARWIKDLGWENRRHKITTQATQKIDKAAAVDIAERLIEHDRAARLLKGATLKALKREAEKDNPDSDALAALGRALKTAIYLERQANGLPTELTKSEHTGEGGGPLEIVMTYVSNNNKSKLGK